MADIDNQIRTKIIVSGLDESGQKIKTLQQQLKELKDAKDRAFQSEDSQSMFKGEARGIEELGRLYEVKYRELQEFQSTLTQATDRRAQQEIAIANKKAQAEVNSAVKASEELDKIHKETLRKKAQYDKQSTDDLLKLGRETIRKQQEQIDAQTKEQIRQVTGNPALEKQQLATAASVSHAQNQSKYNELFGLLPTYTQKMNELNKSFMETYQRFQKSDRKPEDIKKYSQELLTYTQNTKIAKIEQDLFNKTIGKSTTSMDAMMGRIKSHASWIMAGAFIAGAISIPSSVIESYSRLETAMAGVKQVLNAPGQDLEHNQALANEELQKFVSISQRYGEVVEQIVDAGRSWGRMYKDLDTVNFLVSQSAKMATADNFSLAESVKGLESAMAQFGMKSQNFADIQTNSNRVLDVMTKLSHNAGVSAQDLTGGIERAGSAAHQTGVSFEFFNSLLAAGVRNTARTGAEIGQTLKTVFSSIHSDKAIAELDKLGISVYKFSEDGTRSYRDVQDVLLDVALATQNTTKDTEAMNLAISGGKFQWSKASAIFGDYQEILNNWQLAVNSAGFTNEQVQIQMETLSRKMKGFRAEIEGLFSGIGTGGVGEMLKGGVDGMSNFTRGLRDASASSMEWSGRLIKTAGAIWLVMAATKGFGFVQGVATANQALANGATLESIRLDAVKVASTAQVVGAYRAQAVAQGMVAASTTALTSTGAVATSLMAGWPAILALVAYGIYSVVSAQGEMSKANDIVSDKIQVENELLLKQIQMNKQKEGFIDALVTQYNKLQSSIDANSGSTEENSKKQEEQVFMVQKLSEETGIATDQLVIDGKLQVKAINDAKLANSEKTKEALKSNIDLTESNINATDSFINATNERIKKMKEEVAGMSVWAKAKAYVNGLLGNAVKRNADELEGKIENAEANGSDSVEIVNGLSYTVDQAKNRLAQLRNDEEWFSNNSGQAEIDNLEEKVKASTANMEKAKESLANLKAQYASALITPPTTDGKVEETEKERKARLKAEKEALKGYGRANGSSDKLEQKVDNYNAKSTLDQQKIATDNYKASIDALTDSENRLGKSYESLGQRIQFMNNHMAGTKDTIATLTAQMQEDLGKINALADETGATITVNGGGNTPEATAFNYLTNAGYNPEMAAGIIGNLMTESGLNPNAQAQDGSGSYGIGQWLGDRKQGLFDFANANGSDASALETQLAYLVQEMRTTEAGSMAKVSGSTPEEFAYAISKYYERPAWAENPDRQQNARSVYQQYLGGELNGSPQQVSIEGLGDTLGSAGISKETWAGMSTESKTAFLEEHKKDVKDAGLLIGYLKAISDKQKEIARLKKEIAEGNKKVYEETVKGITDIVEYQNKASELRKRSAIAVYGAGATDVQKDQSILDDLIEQKKHSDEALAQAKKFGIDIFKDKTMNEVRVKNLEQGNAIDSQKNKGVTDKYKETADDIEYRKKINEYGIGFDNTVDQNQSKRVVDIDAAKEKVVALQATLDKLRENNKGAFDTKEIKDYNLQLLEAKKTYKELAEAQNKEIRQGLEGITNSVLLQGESLKNVWKKLWSDLANEALKALFHVQDGTQSTLGKILGSLGGSKSSSSSGSNASAFTGLLGNTDWLGSNKKSSGSSGGTNWGSLIGTGLKFFANGGSTDKPAIFGDDGEEVAIPVENHTGNSANLMNYAANKLGMKSYGVTPDFKNADIATKAANITVNSTAQMAKTNSILATQNTILTTMLNTMANNSGNSSPTVVVAGGGQQSPSMEDSANMFSKLQALRYIK